MPTLRVGVPRGVEPLEHALTVVGGYSRAVVVDVQLHLTVETRDLDVHRRARVLQGVLDEVGDDLRESLGIGLRGDRIARRDLELDAPALGCRLEAGDRGADDLTGVDRLRVE